MSRITWGTHSASQVFAYAAITLFGLSFQTVPLTLLVLPWPRNPPITFVIEVWANPRSLAATSGISFDFFSSGY